MDDRPDLQSLEDQLRLAPGLVAEDPSRRAVLFEELTPFAQAAALALVEPFEDAHWREARSLVYLFAYRLADQGFSALAVSASVEAWRRSREGVDAGRVAEVQSLVLDGFARGREDHARASLQSSLAEHLPVALVAPGVVFATAAGPLDAEGARGFADRMGRALLRLEARAALLDLTGLEAPSDGVLLELLSVASSARMLGVVLVTVGHDEGVAAVRSESSVRAPTWVHVETMAKALHLALEHAGQRVVEGGSLAGWVARLWRPPSSAHRPNNG